MKQVYVLLSKTGTVTSKIVDIFAKGEFTHASLALTPDTTKFYSYARRRLYNFLIGGIFVENTNTFVFARFPDAHCSIFELDVSDEGYDKIKAFIDERMAEYDKSKYSYISAPLMRLGIVLRRKKKFTCSQFVAVSLDKSGEIEMPKDPYLMLPRDFPHIKGIRRIYDGTVGDCNFNNASVFKGENNEIK